MMDTDTDKVTYKLCSYPTSTTLPRKNCAREEAYILTMYVYIPCMEEPAYSIDIYILDRTIHNDPYTRCALPREAMAIYNIFELDPTIFPAVLERDSTSCIEVDFGSDEQHEQRE